jgi:hypothetical protein
VSQQTVTLKTLRIGDQVTTGTHQYLVVKNEERAKIMMVNLCEDEPPRPNETPVCAHGYIRIWLERRMWEVYPDVVIYADPRPADEVRTNR